MARGTLVQKNDDDKEEVFGMKTYVRSASFALLASVGAYVTVKYGVPAASGRASSLVRPTTTTTTTAALVPTPPVAAAGGAPKSTFDAQEAWTGVLVSPSVDLVARIDTRVKALHFKVGDHVRAGDSLGELDTTSYQHEIAAAEAALRASQAEGWNASVLVSQAKDREKRREKLYGGMGTGIPGISQEEFMDSKYDRLAASSRAASASASADERKARLAFLHQVVTESTFRAPFDGVLSTRYYEVGSHVTTGTPVLRIVGRGGMRVRFAVPEIEASPVKLTSRVVIEWDNRTLHATVDRIAPEVESASSSIIMEAAVDANSGITVGEAEKKGADALAGRVVGVRIAPALVAATPPRG